MGKTLVNMTMLLVNDEIENVLDSQAEKFYQQAFFTSRFTPRINYLCSESSC
jgi:hypothetical protein